MQLLLAIKVQLLDFVVELHLEIVADFGRFVVPLMIESSWFEPKLIFLRC